MGIPYLIQIIGEGGVSVPTHLFKIIVAEKDGDAPLLGKTRFLNLVECRYVGIKYHYYHCHCCNTISSILSKVMLVIVVVFTLETSSQMEVWKDDIPSSVYGFIFTNMPET